MSVLKERIALMAKYGLLLSEDDLFVKKSRLEVPITYKKERVPSKEGGEGKLDARRRHADELLQPVKEKVAAETKRRLKESRGVEYSTEFRLKVIKAANKSLEGVGRMKRGHVFRRLGDRFRIAPNTIRKWHREQHLR